VEKLLDVCSTTEVGPVYRAVQRSAVQCSAVQWDQCTEQTLHLRTGPSRDI
jgi:hypothetical protein